MAGKKAAEAATYEADATYDVAFVRGIKHPENERLKFVPGREYQVRGRILEGVKDAVGTAKKVE